MTVLSAHTSGLLNADEKQAIAELEASVVELSGIVTLLEDQIRDLLDADRLALNVELSQAGFAMRNSSNDPVNQLQEGETFVISVPWLDWRGDYAFDATSQTVDITASLGALAFVEEIEGIRYYTYTVPPISEDTDIVFSWGKYNDAALSAFLSAAKTVTAKDTPTVVTSATLALSRSGDVVTATVSLPTNAPCRVFWRQQGASEWIPRTPATDNSNYGATVPHEQSFSVPIDTVIEVYARDHIGDTYATAISSIVIPNSLGIDLTGYTSFLDVGTATIPQGSVTTAFINSATSPISNYIGQVFSENMTVELVDNRWALGAVLTPTPNGQYGTTQIRSAHNISNTGDMYLYQRFHIPTEMDWGGEYPYAAGLIGVGMFGGDGTIKTSGGNTNAFAFLPQFAGLPDGTAEIGLLGLSADQQGSTADRINGSNDSSFNAGVPRRLSSGWHSLLVRVKGNSSPSQSDGVLQVWHNAEKIYENLSRQLVSSGGSSVNRFSMSTLSNGVNTSTYNYAPSKVQTIYLADWRYKRVV